MISIDCYFVISKAIKTNCFEAVLTSGYQLKNLTVKKKLLYMVSFYKEFKPLTQPPIYCIDKVCLFVVCKKRLPFGNLFLFSAYALLIQTIINSLFSGIYPRLLFQAPQFPRHHCIQNQHYYLRVFQMLC